MGAYFIGVAVGITVVVIVYVVPWVWRHRNARPGLLNPRLTAGPSQFRVADQTNKTSLLVVNRGRRATFQASVDKVRHFKLADGSETRAHLVPPWQVPWCPGDGWEDGRGLLGGQRELLRKQSALLCIGWFEMQGFQPQTFSLYGIDHHQPYPMLMTREVEITVRVFNRSADRSWAWNVTYKLSQDTIDPAVRIRRRRWWS